MRNARRFGVALLAILLLLAATACTPARLLESVMSGAAQESAAPRPDGAGRRTDRRAGCGTHRGTHRGAHRRAHAGA